MKLNIQDTIINIITDKEEIIRITEEKDILLLALNANKLSISQNKFWNDLDNNFNVVGYADGVGALLRLGLLKRRIPGVELWLEILSNTSHSKIFLYGGSQIVYEESLIKLKSMFPNKEFYGLNGYVDYNDVLENVILFKPTLLIAALGSPLQENILAKLKGDSRLTFSAIGIGGSLDVFTGKVKRVPIIFRKVGMEGLWRILSQPRSRIGGVFKFFKMWSIRIHIIK
jgi:exopolysaccharide biosynthesis WecB/TagA/CpsF family protein